MHVLVAAGAAPPFFVEIALLIVAGALIGYLCQRLGLVPIVGFLVAGVVIGPHALGLVADREMADAAAELGVVLLLFTIGIEFSMEKLARIRRLIFLGGGLQVGLATAVTFAVCTWLGAGWRAALFTGLLVSLSSTVIVLKLLADRGETAEGHGRAGVGLLIFQDLAIVVMVLLVPVLAGGEDGGAGSGLEIALALGKAAAIIAAVLLFARRLMPKLLEKVAETCAPEIFLLAVMALCFGTAWLTSLAGVSLSLGAFLAGLLVSESRFSEAALSEILPLQIVFSALFFLSVGMLLDLSFLARHLPLILGAVALVLVIKVLTTGAAVAAVGQGVPVAAASALMLAQVGEFSFVLERAGREVGLTPAGLGEAGSQAFIAATVLLMIATPPLTALGARSASWLRQRRQRREVEAMTPAVGEAETLPAVPELENHVIVAGYGAAARRLVRVLDGSGVPFLVTTLSPAGAREAEEEGIPVLPGDASRRPILVHAGVERAKMLVVADDAPGMARRIVGVARPLNPTMRIVVRTRWIAEVEPLTEVGADRVVAEELESIVALFDDVLVSFRVAPREIAAHDAALRRGSYALLRAARPEDGDRRDWRDGEDWECDLGPDCLDSRRVQVRPGVPVEGWSWGQLVALLASDYALRADGLWRDGGEVADPPEDLALSAGDELALTGLPADFAAVAELFRADGDAAPDQGAGPGPEGRRTVLRNPVDTERTVELHPQDPSLCGHLDRVRAVHPSAPGCEECLRENGRWVHLRICMICGHVGCCDSSPGRHASGHFRETGHPVLRSMEPGEEWGWCFVDETML